MCLIFVSIVSRLLVEIRSKIEFLLNESADDALDSCGGVVILMPLLLSANNESADDALNFYAADVLAFVEFSNKHTSVIDELFSFLRTTKCCIFEIKRDTEIGINKIEPCFFDGWMS